MVCWTTFTIGWFSHPSNQASQLHQALLVAFPEGFWKWCNIYKEWLWNLAQLPEAHVQAVVTNHSRAPAGPLLISRACLRILGGGFSRIHYSFCHFRRRRFWSVMTYIKNEPREYRIHECIMTYAHISHSFLPALVTDGYGSRGKSNELGK